MTGKIEKRKAKKRIGYMKRVKTTGKYVKVEELWNKDFTPGPPT
jgi:predicted transcriptional regulator YdeE